MNAISLLKSIAKPEDFTVFKLDIDGAPIELPIAHALRDSKELASLVSELFFEHHVLTKAMYGAWGTNLKEIMPDSYELFTALRKNGIRVRPGPRPAVFGIADQPYRHTRGLEETWGKEVYCSRIPQVHTSLSAGLRCATSFRLGGAAEAAPTSRISLGSRWSGSVPQVQPRVVGLHLAVSTQVSRAVSCNFRNSGPSMARCEVRELLGAARVSSAVHHTLMTHFGGLV